MLHIFYIVIGKFLLTQNNNNNNDNNYSQSRALDKMPWRILHDDLRLIDDEQARSFVRIIFHNNTINKYKMILYFSYHWEVPTLR